MAANDILEAQFHYETPSGRASSRLYYRESSPNATIPFSTVDLAESLLATITAPMRNVLSDDFYFTGIVVRLVHPTETRLALTPPNNPYQAAEMPASYKTVDGPGQVGLASGPGLPANNAAVLKLEQTDFSVRSNGRFTIPGIPEVQTTGGTILPGHVATLGALAAALELPQTSINDGGVWDPVVVSGKIRDAAGPGNPKDWITSVALIQSIRVDPIIAISRRRTTEVVGGAR